MPKSASESLSESARENVKDGARIEQQSWMRRVGWLVLIWVLSVLALGVVAGLIRMLMTSAGLTV